MDKEKMAEIIKIMGDFINGLKEVGVDIHLLDGEIKFDNKYSIEFDESKKIATLTFMNGDEPMFIPLDFAIDRVFNREEK